MLKKTRSELLNNMGRTELTQWMAFNALEDEDYKKKIEAIILREKGEEKSEEQLVSELEKMLRGIGTNIDG